MKVCEVCGGMGHNARILCASCDGTGMILLWPGSIGNYERMKFAAREKGAREGWSEHVWEGEPGNARIVTRPIAMQAHCEHCRDARTPDKDGTCPVCGGEMGAKRSDDAA